MTQRGEAGAAFRDAPILLCTNTIGHLGRRPPGDTCGNGRQNSSAVNTLTRPSEGHRRMGAVGRQHSPQPQHLLPPPRGAGLRPAPSSQVPVAAFFHGVTAMFNSSMLKHSLPPLVRFCKDGDLGRGLAGEEADAAVLGLLKGEAAQRGLRLLLHRLLLLVAARPGAPRPLACSGRREAGRHFAHSTFPPAPLCSPSFGPLSSPRPHHLAHPPSATAALSSS